MALRLTPAVVARLIGELPGVRLELHRQRVHLRAFSRAGAEGLRRATDALRSAGVRVSSGPGDYLRVAPFAGEGE